MRLKRTAPTLRHANGTTMPLCNNGAHQFAAFHLLNVFPRTPDNIKAVFSFIPKNACSTMRFSIACHNGLIQPHPSNIDWIHSNNQTMSAGLSESLSADVSFVLLRCPWRRLVSAFMDSVVAPRGSRSGPFTPVPNFRAFVDWVGANPTNKLSNIHWRPQSDFLVLQNYDQYFQVEDMPALTRFTTGELGLIIRDTRSLYGHDTAQHEKVSDVDYSTVNVSTLREMKEVGVVPAPRALYDKYLAKKVEEIYAGDFEMYRAIFGSDSLLFD